ncbi:MAG: ATP-binding protein [Ignavibacteriales bacterium]|nr:ATP-binding protein [Ignavibacteriales bacterium]
MTEQKKIGQVVAVNSGSLTLLVDDTISSLKREIGGKVYYIGQLGSYVLIPVGKQIVVAMVAEMHKADIPVNGDTRQRLQILVTLVGTVKAGRYERGVSVLPPIDAPVFFAEDQDLTAVFSIFQKFGFSIGQLSMFEKERAFLDPNKLFSKHIAVVGSSGSGKSCTVASILQKVAMFPDTNVILIDIHNEYHAAFGVNANYLPIADLELPYWLMNFEEIQEMFIDERDENASSQITVLKDLIVAGKKGKNPDLADFVTVDTPAHFDVAEVRARMQFLDTEKVTGLGMQGATKEGPFYGKFTRFLVRLDSKLNDARYEFMFKPKQFVTTATLSDFLQKIFGPGGSAKVTLMDMSGVPFDIVNTVVSLLARVTFDFNFWNPNRRDFPVLLVFEEAHNYLPSSGESTKAARRTVERIAKEGRKYGVSCMIVSQRPAEVSETILSQCSNYVVLRLTNPVDQNYIRKLVPDTFVGLVDVLPSLRQGEALVVGDALPMPLRVQIDYPNPEPESGDIKFFEKWKQSEAKTYIQDVVQRWWKQERKGTGTE